MVGVVCYCGELVVWEIDELVEVVVDCVVWFLD